MEAKSRHPFVPSNFLHVVLYSQTPSQTIFKAKTSSKCYELGVDLQTV